MDAKILEQKQNTAAAAWREKNSKPAPPTAEEKREYALRGLEKMLAVITPERAARASKLIEEARDHLQRHTVALAELAESPSPHAILREAAEAVGEKLIKHIGGFRDLADAVEYVERKWPLTDARARAAAAHTRRNTLNTVAHRELAAFWEKCERAACIVTGRNSDRELVEIIRVGQL